MTREDKKPAIPEQVEGARQAWQVTAVLQLVLSALAMTAYWLHPEMLMSPETAKENFPGFSEGQIDTALKATIVIAFLFAVGICIGFFAIIERMRKGGEVARSVLVIGSIYLALSALMSFFSATASEAGVPAALVLISGIVRIASATAAVAGLVLASSKEAKAYFERQRPSKPWTPQAQGTHLPKSPQQGSDFKQQKRNQPQPKQLKQPKQTKQPEEHKK